LSRKKNPKGCDSVPGNWIIKYLGLIIGKPRATGTPIFAYVQKRS
jgi:hypothetical protein